MGSLLISPHIHIPSVPPYATPRTFILGFLLEPLLHSPCIRRRSPRALFRPGELLITFSVYLPWVSCAFSRPIVQASAIHLASLY